MSDTDTQDDDTSQIYVNLDNKRRSWNDDIYKPDIAEVPESKPAPKLSSFHRRGRTPIERFYIAVKIVTIVFIFLLVAASALISKVSFFLIISNIFPPKDTLNSSLKTADSQFSYKQKTTEVQWIWAVVLIMTLPYFLTFIFSLWDLTTKKQERENAKLKLLPLALTIETMHSVGLNILVHVLLPALDPVAGVLLCNTVITLPSFLNVFFMAKDRILAKVLQGLAILLNVVSIVLMCVHIATHNAGVGNTAAYTVLAVLTPIFISVSWWENFVPSGKGLDGLKGKLAKLKRAMRKSRASLYTAVYFWKFILAILFPIAVYGISCEDGPACVRTLFVEESSPTTSNDTLELSNYGIIEGCVIHLPIAIAVVCAASSYVCYKAAVAACKIMAQQICFSLSLVFSTPLTIIILLSLFGGNIDIPWCAPDMPELVNGVSELFSVIWAAIAGGVCGYLALLLLTAYIWTPGEKRLSSTHRIFNQTMYCGVLPDVSIFMNRNQEDEHKEEWADVKHTGSKGFPKIYLCATMWHETNFEMLQILKSIFWMDQDQFIRDECNNKLSSEQGSNQQGSHTSVADKDKKIYDPDYYEFEVHVFFDDAFTADGKINSYVQQLIDCTNETARTVFEFDAYCEPPAVVETPYGGQLIFTLPSEQNKMIVHLKDKNKIRRKKRWSQVMYIFYLLRYKLRQEHHCDVENWKAAAEQTFILALDGDVDFKPSAVTLLLDLMKKNSNVGAACGRIHPIGSGVMVWYQKFEYAVSHWLQKAAEAILGCVLCSPGCFSLFRASTLLDVDVGLKYSEIPHQAGQKIQYDQGEDRWLCTLMLQKGKKVEYCAASDALTYAPEEFDEFYNQRRRWTPSTIANIWDLLTTWKSVTSKNPDISIPYIFYQLVLLVSSLITPGTIFLMILGAFALAFPSVDLLITFIINIALVGLQVFLCFKKRKPGEPDRQLLCAFLLTIVYVLIMLIVLIGLVKQMVEDQFCSVTNIFLLYIVGIFLITALLHPQEFTCVLYGLLYFVLTPSMSMLMFIYSIGNLNVVSWGTRETVEKKTEDKEKQASDTEDGSDNKNQHSDPQRAKATTKWFDDEKLRESRKETLMLEEAKFWEELIQDYLEPSYENQSIQEQVTKDLETLRNKKCVQFLFANAVFVIVVFALQRVSAESGTFSIPLPCSSTKSLNQSIEPISVAFTLVFGVLLFVQFLCMLKHRYATFLHVCASTKIFGNKEEDKFQEEYKKLASAIKERPPEVPTKPDPTGRDSVPPIPPRRNLGSSIYYPKRQPRPVPKAKQKAMNRNRGMTLRQKLHLSIGHDQELYKLPEVNGDADSESKF